MRWALFSHFASEKNEEINMTSALTTRLRFYRFFDKRCLLIFCPECFLEKDYSRPGFEDKATSGCFVCNWCLN